MRKLMTVILGLLRNTDQPPWSYIIKAWLIALPPSLVLAAVFSLLAPDLGPTEEISNQPPGFFVFGALIISPWIETLLMWPILAMMQLFLRSPIHAALASAALWGVFHSLIAPTWGFIVAWPFFVFSMSFLEWRKTSRRHAIVVTALVHTCQNLIPALAVLAGS